ncbi:hypothetical protein [Nodosilinea sp. E11]|uniref:hypothetical protein n=1 Tax=Nodosilinea sp. E11 TaxID=3037479 RepID=UPI002934CB30|nr:hypothetical protein [Nodosilinea sp. E11]WOD40248.1 hypothetical protein RRF56_05515 [Nodosilinea sp. E11]
MNNLLQFLCSAQYSLQLGALRTLGRRLALTILSVALVVGLYAPSAQAANGSDAYEAGPIRQTYNPLSKETFQGGVDRTAIDRNGKASQQTPEPERGLVGTIKTLVPGLSADGAGDVAPRSDIQPEKNPTFDRYMTDTQ